MKILTIFVNTIKYLLLTLLVLVVITVAIFIPSINDIRSIGSNSLLAKNDLEQAVDSLYQLDFATALLKSEEANLGFIQSLESLEKVSSRKVIANVSPILNQLNEIKYLLRTGEMVSRSFVSALQITSSISDYEISPSLLDPNHSADNVLLKFLYESQPELIGLRANLELALLDLRRINKFGILYPVYKEVQFLNSELDSAVNLLNQAISISKVVPALAGYPEPSTYLLIMHNTDELRPSGGFIGVYGILESSNGKIDTLTTHDSYHLDMPASISGNWNLEPPEPLSKHLQVKNWYLRDANWSPDWPTSAENILSIYRGEKEAIGEESEKFAGVIGISPDFVADLVDLVGPIEARGEMYYKDNFQELLQYSVEMSYHEYDISQWDRKDVINEIVHELRQRLLKLPINDFAQVLSIVNNNVENKNIQLYFKDPVIQKLAVDLDAAGQVKDTDGDYLLVVDANLAAFKSDAVVNKSIDYELLFSRSESPHANLRLSYRHEGGFDWRTTRYRSYSRVYVPLGSYLNSVEPFGNANLDKDSVSSYNDYDLNKTVFAFFFSLEPGSAGGLDIDYQLPEYLSDISSYSILSQRQSGRRTESFNMRILDGTKLKYENSYPLNRDLYIEKNW